LGANKKVRAVFTKNGEKLLFEQKWPEINNKH
jgi:hypothetical protein